MTFGDVVCDGCFTKFARERNDKHLSFTPKPVQIYYLCDICTRRFSGIGYEIYTVSEMDYRRVRELDREELLIFLGNSPRGIGAIPASDNDQTYWVWQY